MKYFIVRLHGDLCKCACCTAACGSWPADSIHRQFCCGMQIIEKDLLFRNHEVIAPSKSKAIQKLLLKLCKDLRDIAGPCVAAFAIPDAILRAPIGTSTFVNAQDEQLYDGYLRAAGFQLSELI